MSLRSRPSLGLFLGWIILGLPSLVLRAETTQGSPNQLTVRHPLEWQVHQRTSLTGGVIRVEGHLSRPLEATDRLEYQLLPATGTPTPALSLPLHPDSTHFDLGISAPAGDWFTVEIRIRSLTRTVASVLIPHVGVGEVFLIAGQSNSANHGEERLKPTSGLVSTRHEGRWLPAQDPQLGASGNGGSFIPPFGDELVARLKVPIGIISIGVGATSVREWMPAGTRFLNPPTLTGNVRKELDGSWSAKGSLFNRLIERLNEMGPNGIRAVLWHQGESDANQADTTRTLSGSGYRQLLESLIHNSRRDAGWKIPWFVAQVSYHTPDDAGSESIRAAQSSLWTDGIALQGPDSDALVGDLRDGGGRGVHFSGKGLREHGLQWASRVAPWIESPAKVTKESIPTGGRLDLAGTENFKILGRPAFLYLPRTSLQAKTGPQPWIFYAPTLPGLPDAAERWMHERFLAAGVAVAGIDVGEAYGSPSSHPAFLALHDWLRQERGFANKSCLLGRSRGGLAVASWAAAHPERVAGLAGIYPVFDLRSYPGLASAAAAYQLSSEELEARLATLNPIAQIQALVTAQIPSFLIHGDTDPVVPIGPNSLAFREVYKKGKASALFQLEILPGQGHNMFNGFFQSLPLVEFAIAQAREGARH